MTPADGRGRSLGARMLLALSGRPRLLAAFAIGLAVGVLLPGSLAPSTRILLGWDCGTLLYLGASGRMMLRAEADDIRRHAEAQDEGRAAILLITCLAVGASFAAIAAELHGVGDPGAKGTGWRLALAGVTILLSWVTTQVVMAVHYAGAYYGGPGEEGGLAFPGDDAEPDYLDFLYFAFTMGAAAQTSDVAVTSRAMRGLVLAHTGLAFLFNTMILALAVNVGASLI